MALREIARFWDLNEAQVARSALAGSGIVAFLPDEIRASTIWTEQLAIGGIRLCVADRDAEAASTFLKDVAAREAVSNQQRPVTAGEQTYFPLLTPFALLAAGVFGWPLAGLRARRSWIRMTTLALIGATIATLAMMIGVRRY